MKEVIIAFLSLILFTAVCFANGEQGLERSSQLRQENRRNVSKVRTVRPLEERLVPTIPSNIMFPSPGANIPNTEFVGSANSDVNANSSFASGMVTNIDSEDVDPNNEPDVSDDTKTINAGVRQFALDLLTELVTTNPEKNVASSPYSIWSLLLLMLEGAKGETASQIQRALYISSMYRGNIKNRQNYMKLEKSLKTATAGKTVEFIAANGIFYDQDKPPKKRFSDVAKNSYNATLFPIDVNNPVLSAKRVNSWVASTTKNRITHLLSKDDLTEAKLVIANAIFFKGQWKYPFNITATQRAPFYNEQNEKISEVKMMYQKADYLYSFITEINAHVLDMPYIDGRFRMLVIMPQMGTKLRQTLLDMKRFPIDACYDRLIVEQEMYSDQQIIVYLPRFNIQSSWILNENLKHMGIRDIFDISASNITGMYSNNLYLKSMVHVTQIEVTEEGSTSSGATAGMFGNKSGPLKFLANRPFAYFIVENLSKTVIFGGKVYNPSQTN